MKRLIPHVAPNERLRFWLAAVGFMCVAAAALVARTVGDALFLSRYDPNLLPYMYIGSALVVALVSYLYGLCAGRFSIGRLTAGAATVLGLLCVGMRFALVDGVDEMRIVAYFLADVMVNLPMLLFWAFIANLFDLREGKRLFGLVGSAGTLACIGAGLAVRPMAARYGTPNLLLGVAALTGVFIATVLFLSRHEANRLSSTGSTSNRPKSGKVGYYTSLLRARQVRNLMLLMVVMTIVLVSVDFTFKTYARANYAGADLAGFFGAFYAFANLGALVLQLFLVHRVLQYFGLLVALLMTPLAIVTGAVGTALTSAFQWVVALKAVDPVFNFSINNAAMQMLYLGVPKRSRGQARAFVDGVCKPIAMAMAGAAMVVLPAAAGLSHVTQLVAQAVAVLGGLWLLFAWLNYRGYMSGLVESLGARIVDLGHGEMQLSDRALAGHFRNALIEASDDDVPYVAGLLGEMAEIDASDEFRALLGRDSPKVKVVALEYLAEHGNLGDADGVIAHVAHSNAQVRKAAIQASARLAGEHALLALEERLEDEDEEVRASAAAQIINVGDLDGFLAAASTLKDMLRAANASQRAAATRALAQVQSGGLARLLEALLTDPDPTVRVAALLAFRNRPSERLIPKVVGLLASEATAAVAEDVLVSMKERAQAPVRERLDEAIQAGDVTLMTCLPRVLARLQGPAVIESLRKVLAVREPEVRTAGIRALRRFVLLQPATKPYSADLATVLEEELVAADQRLCWLNGVAGLERGEILERALQDAYRQRLRNAFVILDVRSSTVDMNAIYDTIMSGSGDSRARALEVLENVLEPGMKSRVLRLIDGEASAPSGDSSLSVFLGPDNDEWVIVGALYAAMGASGTRWREMIVELLGHGSWVIRETALAALAGLGDETGLAVVCQRLAEDPSPQVRRLVATLQSGGGALA